MPELDEKNGPPARKHSRTNQRGMNSYLSGDWGGGRECHSRKRESRCFHPRLILEFSGCPPQPVLSAAKVCPEPSRRGRA